MTITGTARRLLAGPPLRGGPESLTEHLTRLGPVPTGIAARRAIGELEAAGILGRGGAGFPLGRKWRAIADRVAAGGPQAVVVANGAEGEPASAKDQVLMERRPHLVIDGAVIAADAIGADEIVFYVGREHTAAVAAMSSALAMRAAGIRPKVALMEAPIGYVAGEATAVVHYVNARDARPTSTPPRMSERGVDGRPTLVQNVESLAYAALIARQGAAWYRSAGRLDTRGTALVTLSGPVREPGVREIELGTPLGDVVAEAGGVTAAVGAVLMGGYFGTWAAPADVWAMPLDPAVMRERDLAFGCGIIGLQPAAECGLVATTKILRFLADASARQCGPCTYGLPAMADAMERISLGTAKDDDLDNLQRWTAMVAGRGACSHPDGAVQHLESALAVFADDLVSHVDQRWCLAAGGRAGGAR